MLYWDSRGSIKSHVLWEDMETLEFTYELMISSEKQHPANES